MADTHSGRHGSGHGGGRDSGNGSRRSSKHEGSRHGERTGNRKRRCHGESGEHNEGGGANGSSDELNDEDEISLYGGPIMPFLTDQQIRDGEGFGIPERGPWNGSFAGQNEPFSGQGGQQNERPYPGQNQPIPGSQQLGNNNLAPSGQRTRLDNLPRYNPLDAWAENVSREWDPATFFFDCDSNGGLDSNI
ncbi:hypothetical protein V490_08251 [Pseudogymnoascus sp. VKM F-3557]|nr:hypothetical protein V490_08251 [Pseudogymnoascus sp. VKM F-3557]